METSRLYIYIASIKIIRSSFKLHRLQLSQCTFDNYNNWSEIDDRRIRGRKKLRKMREIFECIRIIVVFQVKNFMIYFNEICIYIDR